MWQSYMKAIMFNNLFFFYQNGKFSTEHRIFSIKNKSLPQKKIVYWFKEGNKEMFILYPINGNKENLNTILGPF